MNIHAPEFVPGVYSADAAAFLPMASAPASVDGLLGNTADVCGTPKAPPGSLFFTDSSSRPLDHFSCANISSIGSCSFEDRWLAMGDPLARTSSDLASNTAPVPQSTSAWAAAVQEKGMREPSSPGPEVYGTRVPLDELFPNVARHKENRESAGGVREPPRRTPLPPARSSLEARAAKACHGWLPVDESPSDWTGAFHPAATSRTSVQPPRLLDSMNSPETSPSSEYWAAPGIVERVAAMALESDDEDPTLTLSLPLASSLIGPTAGAAPTIQQDTFASPRSFWGQAALNGSHVTAQAGSGGHPAAQGVSATRVCAPQDASTRAGEALRQPPSEPPPPKPTQAAAAATPVAAEARAQQLSVCPPPPPSEPPPPPPAELTNWQFMAAKEATESGMLATPAC